MGRPSPLPYKYIVNRNSAGPGPRRGHASSGVGSDTQRTLQVFGGVSCCNRVHYPPGQALFRGSETLGASAKRNEELLGTPESGGARDVNSQCPNRA